MQTVRRDDQQARVPTLEQLIVEAAPVDDHVREQPAVAISPLDVGLEPDEAPFQPLLRVRRGLGPEALHRLAGVDGLGRVDTEQSHGLPPAGVDDLDRVTVDDVDDAYVAYDTATVATQPPPPERGGGHNGHDHGSGASDAGTLVGRCDPNAGVTDHSAAAPQLPGIGRTRRNTAEG